MKHTWTPNDDEELLKAVTRQHEVKIDWNRICSELSKSPLPNQAYSRYKKIKKNNKSKEWTIEEDEKLVSLHSKFVDLEKGEHHLFKGSWEVIANSLGRPKNSCIFRYFLIKNAFKEKSQGATRKFCFYNNMCTRLDFSSKKKEIYHQNVQESKVEESNEVLEEFTQIREEYSEKVDETNEESSQESSDLENEEFSEESDKDDQIFRKPAIHVEYVDKEEFELTSVFVPITEEITYQFDNHSLICKSNVPIGEFTAFQRF